MPANPRDPATRPPLGSGYNPMWRIADQVPNRAGLGVAFTKVEKAGLADAAALLADELFDRSRTPSAERSYLKANDAWEPTSLARAARLAVSALPQLEPRLPHIDGLEARHKLLTALAAGTPSADGRAVRDAVAALVTALLDDLRCALQRTFDAEPAAVAEAVGQVRAAQQAFAWPRPDHRPLQRLATVTAKLAELPQHESQLTQDAREHVAAHLLEEGWAAGERAADVVIGELARVAVARQEPALRASLKELEDRSLRYVQQLDVAGRRLDDNRQAIRADAERLRSSVALTVAGPDRDQVLSGMKAAARCADLVSLVAALRPDLEARLRESARRRYPHVDAGGGSLAALVVELPAAEIVAAVEGLVADHLGVGHSLYELLERHGVIAAAEFLWRRAAPTCFFKGRDHDRFGTPTTEIAIVRLPAAIGPRDEPVRAELAAAFRAQDPTCHVTEGGREQGVSVLRIAAGFPIGVEQSNHALIQRYAVAAEEAHTPHLIGLVPDAPLGEASPGYVRLASNAPDPEPEEQSRDEPVDDDHASA